MKRLDLGAAGGQCRQQSLMGLAVCAMQADVGVEDADRWLLRAGS